MLLGTVIMWLSYQDEFFVFLSQTEMSDFCFGVHARRKRRNIHNTEYNIFCFCSIIKKLHEFMSKLLCSESLRTAWLLWGNSCQVVTENCFFVCLADEDWLELCRLSESSFKCCRIFSGFLYWSFSHSFSFIEDGFIIVLITFV